MYLKIYNIHRKGEIIAVCDRKLLNTTLTCPSYDIIVNPSLYGGDVLASEANVLAAGLIDKESCIMIGDIPHAQIY